MDIPGRVSWVMVDAWKIVPPCDPAHEHPYCHWQCPYYNKGLSLFVERYRKKILKGHLLQVFVLCNFNTTLEQDLDRIYCLRDLGYTPYVMVYNKHKADRIYLHLQRWVNNRALFYTCKTFKDYLER